MEENKDLEQVTDMQADEVNQLSDEQEVCGSELETPSECTAEHEPIEKKFNWKQELWEWTYTLAIAIIAVLIIHNFVLTMVQVEGASMQNTLHTYERLVVLNRNITTINQGDIVVFRPEKNPDRPYIKRVIAVEGQTVDIIGDKVIVDGIVINEPYISSKTARNGGTFPQTIEPGCIFVMGDNRANSQDSRVSSVGQVRLETLIGKAVFRWFPFDKFGAL